MDYIKNRAYLLGNKGFKYILFLVLAIICVVLGSIMFIVEYSIALSPHSYRLGQVGFSYGIIIIISLAILILGIVLFPISRRYINKPMTDQEYDAMVSRYLSNVKKMGLLKLGLDVSEVFEIAPIEIGTYDFHNSIIKRGKDGELRSSTIKRMVLFFTRNEIHCYTIRKSTIKDEIKESTDVYFYDDVVSASTVSDNAIYAGKEFSFENFKITTTGGTSLSVAIPNNESALRSIQGMRSFIRMKKSR